MGGTNQDGHRALRLNGTLTQTDAQVVPPFLSHILGIKCLFVWHCCFRWHEFSQLAKHLIFSSAVNNWIFSETDGVLCCLNRSSLTIFTAKPSANVTCFVLLLRNGCWQQQVCRGAGELATPLRAQTEQSAAQRPTNKRFHICPPPSL